MTPTERIKELIGDERGRQKELAEAIDVATSTLNNWFKRNTDIPASKIIPICEFFGISEYYLLTGNEKKRDALTEDEQELLQTYSTLDKRGKIRVQSKAYDESDRMREEQALDVAVNPNPPPPPPGREEELAHARKFAADLDQTIANAQNKGKPPPGRHSAKPKKAL